MTTAAGFVCSEGIVLCAEMQMTQGWGKYPASKFRTFYDLETQPVFVFASNDVRFTERVLQRLAERILSSGTGRTLLRALEDELRLIDKEFPKATEIHNLLLVIRLGGRKATPDLFYIAGRVISPVLDYCCLGDAQVVAQGLAVELYDRHLNMEQMGFVAGCILAEAKKYGGNSGGNSQILLAWNDRPYEFYFTDHLFRNTDELDEAYFVLKTGFQQVLLDFGNRSVSQESFSHALKVFTENALRKREGFVSDLAYRQQIDTERLRQQEEDKEEEGS
jgi:20S proteasome alpha/beta subunit